MMNMGVINIIGGKNLCDMIQNRRLPPPVLNLTMLNDVKREIIRLKAVLVPAINRLVIIPLMAASEIPGPPKILFEKCWRVILAGIR